MGRLGIRLLLRHRLASLAGLIIGLLPGVGFFLFYLNRGAPTTAPIYSYLSWFYWPGLPAEVLLNSTGLYFVPLGAAHMSPREIVARWVVFVLVNVVLWILGMISAVELWMRIRRTYASSQTKYTGGDPR